MCDHVECYLLLSTDDEKSLLHFKLRVLDLVEVFIRRESSNPLVLVGLVYIQLHDTSRSLQILYSRTTVMHVNITLVLWPIGLVYNNHVQISNPLQLIWVTLSGEVQWGGDCTPNKP